MAVSLLTRELEWWDQCFYGCTPKGLACGVDAWCGLGGWCNPSGVHLLYRGTPDADDIDYAAPVGASSPTSASPATISNFAWFAAAASTVYWFAVRAVGRGGAEEASGTVPVRIETDGDGVPLAPIPNPPINLTVAPAAGGRFVLAWDYSHRGEQVAPASYRVYHDDGTGSMDYVTPLATVTGRRYKTPAGGGAYSDGQTVQFVVRAVSAAGGEEKNTNIVSGEVNSGGPVDLGAPTITTGEES